MKEKVKGEKEVEEKGEDNKETKEELEKKEIE